MSDKEMMSGSTKAVLHRIVFFGFLLAIMAVLAACPMSNMGYGSGGYSGVPPGGPPYTVTYRNTTANTTGSVPMDTTQYASGATVTVLGNTGSLSWSGFTFTGWNTLDYGTDGGGGGGTFYAPGATFTITSNVVLYGTWNP
jgi:hypothetical protein